MTVRNGPPRPPFSRETPDIINEQPRSGPPGDRASDAACTIPWVVDEFEAIQVFVDPGLRDRVSELCSLVDTWAGTHRDLDSLSEAARVWSQREDVNASIYENPRDDISVGTVAIAFEIG